MKKISHWNNRSVTGAYPKRFYALQGLPTGGEWRKWRKNENQWSNSF
ncbi:MAG: hypothetical protein Q8K66_11740 [Sediminibacterium sp.]|nr:hypothetical protein [Sediminibacterium sp.]MDP3129112.1 hypothetical protein [Sediminibacterium sp.]